MKLSEFAKLVVLVARKGGVGKSYMAMNLFIHAYLSGYNVLLMEFEPQKDLLEMFGLREEDIAECNVKSMLEHAFTDDSDFQALSVKETKICKKCREIVEKLRGKGAFCGQKADFIGGHKKVSKTVDDLLTENTRNRKAHTFYAMVNILVNRLRAKYDLIIIDTHAAYDDEIEARQQEFDVLCEVAMRLAQKDDALLIVTDKVNAAKNNAELLEMLAQPDILDGKGKKPILLQILNHWQLDRHETLLQLDDEVRTAVDKDEAVNAIDFYGKKYFNSTWCKPTSGEHQRIGRTSLYDDYRTRDNLVAESCEDILRKINDKTIPHVLDSLSGDVISDYTEQMRNLDYVTENSPYHRNERIKNERKEK